MTNPAEASVAVVTGASSGIGEATAIECARAGMAVVAAARREALLDALVERIRHDGGRALAVVTDVRSDSDVEALMRRAMSTFGRIDVLVVSAGVAFHSAVADASPEHLADIIETNYTGVVRTVRAALPHMLGQGSGHIIVVGSVSSVLMWPNDAVYGSTKAAVHRFARGLENELRPSGIHVTNVVPGVVDTPLTRKLEGTRKASPQHVARMIVRAIRSPRPVVITPFAFRLLLAVERIAPALARRLVALYLRSHR